MARRATAVNFSRDLKYIFRVFPLCTDADLEQKTPPTAGEFSLSGRKVYLNESRGYPGIGSNYLAQSIGMIQPKPAT